MSVSGISSTNTNVYQPSTQQPGMRYYVRQLGQALQSGDLSAAQQAYASLSQLPQFQNAQSGQSSTGVTASTNGATTTGVTGSASDSPFANTVQTLTQIGSDLQSGDLSSAQQAFSSMQQQWQGGAQANAADPTGQMQGLGGHHHHHHHASETSDASSGTSGTGSTSSSGSTDPLLAMLTDIENTLTSIQTDLSGGANGGTVIGSTGTTNTAATITPPVNIMT